MLFCVYSMIADHFYEKWKRWVPQQPVIPTGPMNPNLPVIIPMPGWPQTIPVPVQDETAVTLPAPQLTPEEIEDLRKLLERAKKYDEETGQKECELEEKKRRLIELAEQLGAKIVLP